jgi:hypothetical protein
MALSACAKMEKALDEDAPCYADIAVHVAKHVIYYNTLCNKSLRSLRSVVILPGIDVHELDLKELFRFIAPER